MTFIQHIVYLNHVHTVLYNYTSINYLEGKKHSSEWIGRGSRAQVADSHWEIVEGISSTWEKIKVLSKKDNKWTKWSRNKLIDIENKLMVSREGRYGIEE